MRTMRAEALHDLFTVAVETHNVAEGESLARRALHAYPSGHPRIPALAHDVAVFWMLQGYHARALPVLQAVARVISRHSDRLVTWSNLARAAGGARQADVFAAAWTATWQIIDEQPSLDCVTSSLLRLAYGSAHLEDWERVRLAAGYSAELADRRGQDAVRREAQLLLDAREQERFSSPKYSPSIRSTGDFDSDTLAAEFVRRLSACAGGADRPRMQC